MKQEPPTVDLSDARLDRLLSGEDRLTSREKEEILEGIFAKVAPAPPPARSGWPLRRWASGVLALAAMGAIGAAVVLSRRPPELTARGARGPAPAFELSCVDASLRPAACERGARLVFWISPGRFRAFAVVALSPEGKTFWYFPSGEHGKSAILDDTEAAGPLKQVAMLDDRHAPGDYAVYGVFSLEPLSKEQVRRAVERPEEQGAAVVRRTLRVEARSP